VTSGSGWELDEVRLRETLERWNRRCRRTRDKNFVYEFLMDLVEDPLNCGREDPASGIWTGAAGGIVRPITIVYYPDRAARRVFVTDINYS